VYSSSIGRWVLIWDLAIQTQIIIETCLKAGCKRKHL
jgi:hypothetical protein